MSARAPRNSATPVAAGRELTPDQIEARLRWARRRGHGAWLWPDIDVEAWRSSQREIERVASLALADRAPIRFEAPPGASAEALGIAAFTSGMGPLLGWWIEHGILVAPHDVAFRMKTHLVHGRERAERLARALRATFDVLDGAGIRAFVLKGMHTGSACFPEPGTRPAADIDLAVAPCDVAATVHALAAAGYERIKSRSRPWKSDWCPPGAPRRLRSIDLNHGDNPFTVEMHDGLDRVFYGVKALRFGPPDAWRTERAPGLHPSAFVLGEPWLAAFLAAHASEELHQLQLVRLVELAFVLRQDREAGTLDWDELDALLDRLDARRFVWPAFELTERVAPGTLDPAFRRRLAEAATPRMRRVLERLTPGTAQRLDSFSLDERFLWARGPVETIRRVAWLLWPTRGESTSLRDVYARRLSGLLRGRVRLRRR